MISETGEQRDEPISRTHLTVFGRVQGVGFRAFTVSTALPLGITGWVRNSSDGRSVEIVAVGPDQAVRKLVDAVRRGPPASKVTHIEQRDLVSSEPFNSFSVRY